MDCPKRNRFTCIFLILLAAQLACGVPFSRQGAATPAPLTPTETAATALPPTAEPPGQPATLVAPTSAAPDLEALKNFSYYLDEFKAQVTLVDGVYEGGDLHTRLVEPAASGDINGDGAQDAAVMLATNSGGSGTFFDLIVLLGSGGGLAQAADVYVGDRQGVNNLTISEGRVVLDYRTQSFSDPFCCPSERHLRSYVLEQGALRLASDQIIPGEGPAPAPLPDMILIDRPAWGDEPTSPLRVQGRVSQAPPELKLTYRAQDINGAVVAQGEAPVQGQPGGPGSFDFEIAALDASTGVVYIEITDGQMDALRGRSLVQLVRK